MIDFEYYTDTWGGSFSGTEGEFNALLSRAIDVVDNAIFLTGVTVATVSTTWQDRVYKAVCSQVDYIDSNGGVSSMTDGSYGSVSLGKFSYSADSTGGASSNATKLCDMAISYLLPTGLLYRGIDTV